MFLTGKIINPDATLNNFVYQDQGVEFLPSSSVVIALQLFDPAKKMRYIPPSTAVITFTFNNADFTTFTQESSFINTQDCSLLLINLSTTQTAYMVGGNLTFTVDVYGNGSLIYNGLIQDALQFVDVTV